MKKILSILVVAWLIISMMIFCPVSAEDAVEDPVALVNVQLSPATSGISVRIDMISASPPAAVKVDDGTWWPGFPPAGPPSPLPPPWASFAQTTTDGSGLARFRVFNGAGMLYADIRITVAGEFSKDIYLPYLHSPYTPPSYTFIWHKVTFDHTGLDSTATGTVVTVDSSTKTYTDLPYEMWVYCGDSVTYSYESIVSSTIIGKQFVLTSVTGPTSPITVTSPVTVIGNYETRYKEYVVLSTTYYDDTDWNNVFAAPDGLTNGWGSKIFVLTWTGGWLEIECFNGFWVGDWYSVWLVDQNSGALSCIGTTPEVETDWHHTGCPYLLHTGAGNVYSHGVFNLWLDPGTYEFRVRNELFQLLTGARPSACVGPLDGWSPAGYYIGFHRKHLITFDQTGVGPDFTGTVVTIDSVGYGVSALPVSFWWRENSVHSFSFASPLDTLLGKRYVWTSTTGLSTLQSDTLTITASGSVTGNYKTQYYLTVLIYPDGLAPPPTPPSGWYDHCTYVTLTASPTTHKDALVYTFSCWRINGQWQKYKENTITIHMDSPKIAVACYCELGDPIGDVNLDGEVNMLDIAMIAKHYGAKLGEPNYSVGCDLNLDGKIDLRDLATAARNFA